MKLMCIDSSGVFDYFIGYGIIAAIGLSIVLFLMGPIDKDLELEKLNQQLNPEIDEPVQPGSAVIENA